MFIGLVKLNSQSLLCLVSSGVVINNKFNFKHSIFYVLDIKVVEMGKKNSTEKNADL